MKLLDTALSAVGLGPGRKQPPPDIVAISEGLLITSTKAEAWFVLGTANTDTATEAVVDAGLDSIISTASKSLKNMDCHLKVLWGRINGDEYEAEAVGFYGGGLGDGARWAADRAERIDVLGLPQRYLLLGVTLVDREQAGLAQAKRAAGDLAGISTRTIKDTELAHYFGLARRIQQSLVNTTWKARFASAETIAWAVGREQHRGNTAIARRGTIQGAALHTLKSGKVVPYPDHLRIYDNSGNVAAYTSVLTLSDFPEEIEIPGDSEWLRTLSDISRIESEDPEQIGQERPVIVEASVRFRILPKAKAMKMSEEARKAAKEQRRSAAKNSAGDVTEDILEAEELAEQTTSLIKKSGLTLVEAHPRLLVTASTLDELEINRQAVVDHYGGLGITAVVSADEQRDLWLESLPGDNVRVQDLGQIMDTVAFFGSYFWGGSKVGDESGPVSGFLTGSTPGLVRSTVTAGGDRGDATTTVFVGRSGRGKSTAMELEMLNVAFLSEGVWQTLLDFKGDLAGICAVAEEYGIPNYLVRVTEKHAGAADLFLSLEADEAAAAVTRQLTLLAPARFLDIAEPAALRAATTVAAQPNPTTWATIQYLVSSEDTRTREFGQYLVDLSQTKLGRIVLAEPNGLLALRDEPGIWNIQLPNLTLPSSHSNPASWDSSQKISMAAVRGFTAHALKMSSSPRLRSMAKLVAVPEVHRMLRTDDGADFLDSIARMGRAYNTSLLLDSQDAEGISRVPGLAEQLQGVRVFQLTTWDQQRAAAALLGMPETPETAALIRSLGMDPGSPNGLRKGHCLFRDYREEVATVQYDYPNQLVADLLSTNPDQSLGIVDLEPEQEETFLEEVEMAS